MASTPTAFSIGKGNNSSTNHEIEREDADLLTSIQVVLNKLPPKSSECCIYRIPRKLRNINEEVYTPQAISIGPFHHGKEHLRNMEEYKLRHLQDFLDRTETTLEYYLQIVKKWEERARLCYAETIELSRGEFVKMMLVDASFIIEFLLRKTEGKGAMFHQQWMVNQIPIDMVLLENQLPLFVLDGLFNSIPQEIIISLRPTLNNIILSSIPNVNEIILSLMPDLIKENISFVTLLFNQYHGMYKFLPPTTYSPQIKHFVDFICTSYRSPFQEVEPQGNTRCGFLHNMKDHFITFIRYCYFLLFQQVQQERHTGYERSPSVIELHQAGIEFKKRTSTSLFDIKFENGILEIPQLTIEDSTGCCFQNLIAFEQCHQVPKCIITDYVALLDGMINTSKDVDLLIQNEIIVNMLGSSDDVSTLFNNICREIFCGCTFSFSELCQKLNEYCRSPRHKWMATLRREYFSTPWKTVSFFAAVILLVLTSIQTICSIHSW